MRLGQEARLAAGAAEEVAHAVVLGDDDARDRPLRESRATSAGELGNQAQAERGEGQSHQPALVIADEPTGNLDSANGATVLTLLAELNRDLGVTILLATHSADVAHTARRTVHLRDGRLDAGLPATAQAQAG